MNRRLPVVCVGAAHAEVAAALAWLATWGAPELEVCCVRVELADVRVRFGAAGGMARGRFNSQALVRDAILALAPAQRELVASAPERVVLVAPQGFHPHVWQPRDGGVSFGAGRWLRRYALIPDASPLGHIAHELGHLLYDWPDLHLVPGLGQGCLMARGAERAAGPAAPCAALRVAAGWVEPQRVSTATRVEAVHGVWCWQHAELRIVGERTGDALHVARVDARGWPLRAASVRAVAGRTLVGSIAAAL
jgi:hypothetical protein